MIDFPTSIWIEPTNECFKQCDFCFQSKDTFTRTIGYMTNDLYIKIINEIAQHPQTTISLHHSGEPLMHPQIHNFIRYAVAKGIHVSLTTNGELIEPTLFDTMLHTINISLGTVDTTTYENLAKFTDQPHGTQVHVNAIANGHNARAIAQAKRFFMQHGADRFIIRPMIGFWNGQHKNNMIKNLARFVQAPFTGLCQSVQTSLGILWDGTVVPCCLDYNGTIVLGYATRQSLTEMWHGDQHRYLMQMLSSYRATARHPVCGPCREIAKGGV